MYHYMGQEGIWQHISEAKYGLGIVFFEPVDSFCEEYDKKNKSDSQKYIRLPLSFFSFSFFYGLSFLYILISMGLYFLQYGFQSSDEVIYIFLGQYQWREDTEDVGAGATGEAVLLVDELAANFLVRNIEYGSYH